MINVKQNGFVYHKETMLMLNEFEAGNEIYITESFVALFYGSKKQAIEFGIIFNLEEQEEEKKD